MQGMFMDGMIYGAVARNLSLGLGNFWHLKFSDTLLQPFHEHPPLAFYLESLVFRLVGDFYFVERLYAFIIALSTALLLAKLFIRSGGSAPMAWLPVLLWISTERVFWSINQNMLEVTMSFFSLLSVYLLHSAEEKAGRRKFLRMFLAALMLLAAFLSKGFPGLFPLGFYFCQALSLPEKKISSFLKPTLLVLFYFCLAAALLLIFQPEAKESLLKWFLQQVAGSVQGQDRTGLRWPFISGFFQQLLPMLALIFLQIIVLKLRKKEIPKLLPALKLLLLTGLSAFVPLLVSPKLSFYYFVPAIPYFALAAALYLQQGLQSMLSLPVEKKWMRPIALLVFLGSLIYSITQAGNYERNATLQEDVQKICRHVKANDTVSVAPSLSEDWTLFAYLQRIGRVNVIKENNARFYLIPRSEAIPAGKKEISADLSEFRLFSVSNNQ